MIENFEIPGERIACGPLPSRPYQYITEQITIQPNSDVIPINFIQDGWIGDTFQISEGLKYGNGEVDQFTIPFSVKHNSSEYLTSYSFDFFIQSYWCNLSQCTDKNVIQSETVHAKRLGACRLQ